MEFLLNVTHRGSPTSNLKTLKPMEEDSWSPLQRCFSWLLLLKMAHTKTLVLKTVDLGHFYIVLQTLQLGENLINK